MTAQPPAHIDEGRRQGVWNLFVAAGRQSSSSKTPSAPAVPFLLDFFPATKRRTVCLIDQQWMRPLPERESRQMAHLHRLFAIRATRISGLERASEGSQDKGRKMKITRAIRFTIVAVVMAGAVLATVVAPAAASARVFVSVGIAPPLIPVYDQPIAPGYGYLWTPGYWAYGPDGYYWVDGA